MAEKKEKQYVSDNAQLMSEWDWEKNNALGLDPSKLTYGSGKKAHWKCSYGHTWDARIDHRTKGIGCPICSKKTRAFKKRKHLIEVVGSLADRDPLLSKEWHPYKNKDLLPKDVTCNSNIKVWWLCSNGHEWQSTISNRHSGRNCPFCSGRKVIKGKNDLLTTNPDLALEWNFEKNGNLTPLDVLPNSGKKVWWKCSKGHEWEAIIQSRTGGNGCPFCNSERNSSFPEYALVYYLGKCGMEVIHTYKAHGYELDIYIPSKKIAIEYDGYFWHKDKTEKDLIKNTKCQRDGITLYRIREGLPSLNDSSIDYAIQKNQRDLPQVIELIISEIIGANVVVNLENDAIDIENLREHTEKENSLLFTNSSLAAEWNFVRNGNITPEHFLPNSNKKVWWNCKKGHEWQAAISTRNKGIGCPFCAGQKVLQGFNDLQTVNPTLANEWNYEKNGALHPNAVTKSNGQKVWWKCSEGHEWQATIAHRSNGQGCPYCSGLYVIAGVNDLLATNSILASEWNYEKNDSLTPNDVLPNSNKKVWWRCKKGHEWQARIQDRTRGKGCPYCSGRYAVKGENDLQTINPSLAYEWNYEKNNGLTPSDVLPNSGKEVWWRCERGHEWQARIQSRNRGCGCPECAKQKRKKKDT